MAFGFVAVFAAALGAGFVLAFGFAFVGAFVDFTLGFATSRVYGSAMLPCGDERHPRDRNRRDLSCWVGFELPARNGYVSNRPLEDWPHLHEPASGGPLYVMSVLPEINELARTTGVEALRAYFRWANSD